MTTIYRVQHCAPMVVGHTARRLEVVGVGAWPGVAQHPG